jgi:hypothetical protein
VKRRQARPRNAAAPLNKTKVDVRNERDPVTSGPDRKKRSLGGAGGRIVENKAAPARALRKLRISPLISVRRLYYKGSVVSRRDR